MADSLAVILDNSHAGTLTRLSGGRLSFEYDAAYRERETAIPLSVSMPVPLRSHPDSVISPWLWGLLPDNEAVLRRWAREFQASARSPYSMLSTPIGEDCAGAVRFAKTEDVEQALRRRGSVKWLDDAEVGERLHTLKEDSTAWLGRPFVGQFSLAGAQAKTALLYDNGRWGVPSGATPTTHILKPAVAGLDDHDLNEHLCLDAARRAGLIVARTSVQRFAGESAIVVERYDRLRVGRRVTRIHQEDLCQALSLPPSRKYQNEGGPSASDIVQLFRRVMPAQAAEDSVWRFIDALAWNWLIAGTDAHAKNYSLLLGSDQVRLAPLYDVASALPYHIHEKKLRFAMKLGGDYRVFTYRNTWPKVADELDVDRETLLDRVRDLTSRVSDVFADSASAADVKALKSKLPARIVDLVSERASRCAALLDTGQRTNPTRAAR
jgi:serine/threonine-protein kinase HipA